MTPKVLAPSGRILCPANASRATWLKMRKVGLGASDTATILGLSPYGTALEVWLEKWSPTVDSSAGEAAEWGLALESAVARKVNSRHRNEIGHVFPSPGLLQHVDYDWMLATPDRLLWTPFKTDRPAVYADALLEIKTAGHRQEHRWTDGVPAYYQIQVQQQLACAGLEYGYLCVLHGGQRMPQPYRITRNDRVIQQIVDYAGGWWDRHMVKGERPMPTFPADADNLSTLWTADKDAKAVEADLELKGIVERYRVARLEEKEAKERKARAAFEIKTRLQDATTVLGDDEDAKPLATWKASPRRDLDVARLKAEMPDVYSEFVNTTEIRTLRVPD